MQKVDEIEVLFAGADYGLINASIYDALGKVIMTSSHVSASGQRLAWTTQQLSAGVYTLVLNTDTHAVFTQKFIK